jgi:hypothetical protein
VFRTFRAPTSYLKKHFFLKSKASKSIYFITDVDDFNSSIIKVHQLCFSILYEGFGWPIVEAMAWDASHYNK